MIAKITDDLYVLSSDTSPLSSLVYLLKAGDKRLIIDTGDSSIDFEFTPDIVILTHNHLDHTKGVKKEWKNVFMHEADILSDNDYSYVPSQCRPIDELTKGGMLSFGRFALMVYHTPGHTKGSISLYDSDRRILFSGDTWFGNGFYGRTDIGGNTEELMKSLRFLMSLKVDILCPGHRV